VKQPIRKLLGLALASVACASAAAAMAWPDKPVTVVVPFPPGGTTDTVARAVANQLSAQLGQSFVVENKPGATGAIGAHQVVRAPADGYTLLISSLAPFVVAPHLQKTLPYDPRNDFSYLSVAVQAPNVLVVNPELAARVNSIQDVLAMLKAKPGEVSFATSGAGSSDHLTAELFWQKTGTKGLHVPYKGGAPAIADLLGNQVNMSFQNVNAVFPHIQSGKLKPIAVTGSHRSPVLPNVPTLAESGVEGVDVYSWQGIAAPAGLPADVQKTLHGAIVKALNAPSVSKPFTDIGLEIVANTPDEFTRFQAQEYDRWKDVVAKGGFEVQ